MATYKIGNIPGLPGYTGSSTTGSGELFNKNEAAASSFTLDPGAFLISTGGLVNATLFNGMGAWTITINGAVQGQHSGIYLLAPNSSPPPTYVGGGASSITIGEDGSVRSHEGGVGDAAAAVYTERDVTIKNAGTVLSDLGSGMTIGGYGTSSVTNTGTITGGNDDAIHFYHTTKGSVTNSGRIIGGITFGSGDSSLTNSEAGYIYASSTADGITFGAGNDTLTNLGTAYAFASMGDGTNKVTNSGYLDTDSNAYSILGGANADTVSNSKTGYMLGGVWLGDGVNKLTNDGRIGGDSVDNNSCIGGAGADTVTNSKTGVMSGDVYLLDGTNSFTNAGTVGYAPNNHASYFGGGDQDTITNTGTLKGYVDSGVGGGLNTFTNSGSVGDKVGDGTGIAYWGGADTDTVKNNSPGWLHGSVILNDGANSLTNSGTIGVAGFTGTAVSGGANVDNITNSGTMNGDVSLFGGNDIFKNTGLVSGQIYLGDGDDTFTGGNFADFVHDDLGKDSYDLGGGNDTFYAFGGEGDVSNSKVAGGAGQDRFDASSFGGHGLLINMDSVAHTGISATTVGGVEAKTITIQKSFAQDATLTHGDTISGFEIVQGSTSNDLMFGSATADVVYGNGGLDEMWGLAGNDELHSGTNGGAFMVGGAGADKLYGQASGAVLDYFVFTAASDSGVTKATRDQIFGFNEGAADRIVFTGALAGKFNLGTVNNNDFFHKVAGELHSYDTATGQMIEGDLNGDGKADFSIYVDGTQGYTWHLTAGSNGELLG